MNNQYIKFAGMYTFSYMSIGVLLPLMPQHLNAIGFSGTEIGTLAAVGTTIGIFSTPLLVGLYDHTRRSKWVMALAYIMPAIFVGLMRASELYPVLLILYGMGIFFQAPMFAMEDANALASPNNFGKVRKWGAAGYAVGSMLAGLLVAKAGLSGIFPGYGLAMIIALLFFVTIKKSTYTSRHDGRGNAKTGFVQGFKMLAGNKKFIGFTASAFLVVGTSIAHNTYFGFMFTEAGGDYTGIGLAFLLMAGSEMPFMQITDYILQKMSVQKLVLIPIIVAALRFLWYFTLPNPMLIYIFCFLQGIANGLFIVGALNYVALLAGKDKAAVAIGVYTAATASLGTICCQLLGGVVLDMFSGHAVYLVFGIMNLVSAILYIGFGLHKEKKIYV